MHRRISDESTCIEFLYDRLDEDLKGFTPGEGAGPDDHVQVARNAMFEVEKLRADVDARLDRVERTAWRDPQADRKALRRKVPADLEGVAEALARLAEQMHGRLDRARAANPERAEELDRALAGDQ